MDEQSFADRLAELRMEKNISAREMSLAFGQNPSYFNRIENGKVYPSMQGFFYICEYLGVSPTESFDANDRSPCRRKEICGELVGLSEERLDLILALIRSMKRD